MTTTNGRMATHAETVDGSTEITYQTTQIVRGGDDENHCSAYVMARPAVTHSDDTPCHTWDLGRAEHT